MEVNEMLTVYIDSTAFVQREVKSTVSCRVYVEAQNHFLLHFPNKDIFHFYRCYQFLQILYLTVYSACMGGFYFS